MEALVFISTAWGPKYGGINSFNTELCKAFPTILPNSSYTIFCFCYEVTGEDVEEGKNVGIKLFQINEETSINDQANNILSILEQFEKSKVKWWFGHDIITGELANHCKIVSSEGQLAIFHHMNYIEYSGFKYEDGGEVIKYSNSQKSIMNNADVIYAIGPKLYESALSLTSGYPDKKIYEIIPGFIDILPSVQNEPFKAIVVGRLGNDDDVIKQFRLSVAAFARALDLYSKAFSHGSTIILFGVPKEEVKQTKESLTELGYKYANRLVNVLPVPFEEKQNIITDHLRSSWVSLMLSLHEGFGLSGWEAIAAEVPLIVSENSGLYQLIEKKLGGAGIGSLKAVDIKGKPGIEHFSDDDVNNVANQIAAIRLSIKNARRDSHYLKRSLSMYSWQSTALQIANGCSLRSILIAGEKPGEYVQEILKTSDAFDELVSRRTIHFDQIFDRIDRHANEINRLVLFGGISSLLRDDNATRNYAIWLIRNLIASLYICFESGPSAESRAQTLDTKLLDKEDGLPQNPLERMRIKEKQVLSLKDKLKNLIGTDVLKRIHFIPILVPLTNYTILCGNELYVAPVLHGPSSHSESIRLPSKPSPYRTQFLDYMLFHLNNSSSTASIETLINEINTARIID